MNNKTHILIVDDSPTLRAGLKYELENLGFSIFQAEDGQAGLEAVKSQPFDLVITDVEMPRMDGFTLCEKIKQNPSLCSIPVIILSSCDTDADVERGFRIGASAFVSKSKAKQEIFQRIQEVLQRTLFLQRQLILVVDDSKTICNLVKDGLVREGFQVALAENGKEALDYLEKNRPDLILSDLAMPVMDGFALCARLKSDPQWASIPFIAMSSSSERSVMRRILELGGCAFLIKPFNMDQLIFTLDKILSDHFQLILKERERLEGERQLMIGSITGLVGALEARDTYTRGHSETVARISLGIAERMGFQGDDLENVEMAGRLHDLGKIGIRDSILFKPDELTQEEFDLIKKHPIIGAEILNPIPSMAPVIPGVLYHHERMDGGGYPDRLKGKEIPLLARIIAVADTYDAMTSNRLYRIGQSDDEAFQIIQEASPSQLCPDCVRLFFDWVGSQKESPRIPSPV